MIGFYDYTVILTYLSLISAGTGIIVTLSGGGHPYLGIFFLLFCGLCDAFDGQVARTKKNRSQMEINFGIQIDSLVDLIAFGVLPACIGVSLIRTSPFLRSLEDMAQGNALLQVIRLLMYGILVLYILAAMIRLAYFNVTEEERQRTEGGVRKYYTGLPVTSASIIFPTVMMFHYLLPTDISVLYFPVTMLTAICFLAKFQIPKLGLRGILVLVALGMVEAVALIAFLYMKLKGLL